jgi:2,3-diketo-5-methylthio-1-phosphopentane phosphatase
MPAVDASQRPVLFFDFDNTVTRGDVLDAVIERYSATEAWRECEAEWRDGRITTLECLQRQIGGLRVSEDELLSFVSTATIDPAFHEIVAWANRKSLELTIVSDSFSPLIHRILQANDLRSVRVLANELEFDGDRPRASFPLRDPSCARCAHCKGRHLREATARPRIFIGDGLSDVCAALAADVVFAKDSLAREMTRRAIAFHRYASLADVRDFLRGRFGD